MTKDFVNKIKDGFEAENEESDIIGKNLWEEVRAD